MDVRAVELVNDVIVVRININASAIGEFKLNITCLGRNAQAVKPRRLTA